MDWGQVIASAVGVAGPIIFYQWRTAKKLHAEQDERHRQNIDLLNEIVNERKYIVPHDHAERTGTLSVDGIRRAPEIRNRFRDSKEPWK